MYGRDFVACVLAGFEETLDALIDGVDEDAQSELQALGDHIVEVRFRFYPGAAMKLIARL